MSIKLEQKKDFVDKEVSFTGWVHRCRKQGKKMVFLIMRDSTDLIQVLLSGDLALNVGQEIVEETFVRIFGKITADARAEGGFEVHAIKAEILGKSHSDFNSQVSIESGPHVKLDKRHLVLREDRVRMIMHIRAEILYLFRDWFRIEHVLEVKCPSLTNTCCESGSTLFELQYYNEKAYLTQSSQMYLETCLSSLGDIFTIQDSWRSEKSSTRRHLSEYTHVEAEYGYITFPELLKRIENMLEYILTGLKHNSKIWGMIKTLNPTFEIPQFPLKRVRYDDAIKLCNEIGLKNEKDEPYKWGDDLTDLAEKKLAEKINAPFFLTHFPAKIKAFYMLKDLDNPETTQSTDLIWDLEILGGSMRISDYDELMTAYKNNNINPELYYWYTDQRKYGFPGNKAENKSSGGFGLGLERLIMCITKIDSVKDATLYPRYFGRCSP